MKLIVPSFQESGPVRIPFELAAGGKTVSGAADLTVELLDGKQTRSAWR